MRRIRRSEAIPRSMASGASSFMSPPPWPRRTTSFSRVNVSKRSPPTGRASTRWKLFVPMSRAPSTVPSAMALISCRCASDRVPDWSAGGAGIRHVVSVLQELFAGVDPAEDAGAEAGDLLEGAAQHVVGGAVVTGDQCGLDGLVEVAGLDEDAAGGAALLVRHERLRPGAGEAVVDEGAVLTRQRAVERRLGGLAPGRSEHVADGEVAHLLVALPGQRLVEEHGPAGRAEQGADLGIAHRLLVARDVTGRRERHELEGLERFGAPAQHGRPELVEIALGEAGDLALAVAELRVAPGVAVGANEHVGHQRQRVVDELGTARRAFVEADLEG